MSHPPETSLSSRELADLIERECYRAVTSELTSFATSHCAALINAWVRQERDIAHAAAINAAAQICEDWSASCWDIFRDQAMAVAQRAVNIRALTANRKQLEEKL